MYQDFYGSIRIATFRGHKIIAKLAQRLKYCNTFGFGICA